MSTSPAVPVVSSPLSADGEEFEKALTPLTDPESSDKALSVNALFDYGKVPYDKESEVHLDVILHAPEKTDSKRIPLHLILAIDCSGSMHGSKLDSVKTTVNKLVDHLTENDTLGIMGFSENCWDVISALPMTKENKELAKNNVKKLNTISNTNLEIAIKMAMEKAVISDESKICRIVLLTDGLPTSGECGRDELIKLAGNMNKTVSMTTFGYGSDYDAELMASISNVGRGNSFYIKSDEDCNKAFAMELGGLLSLYAQNLKLIITPSGNMQFKEFLSEYRCDQKNGYRRLTNVRIEVSIDDIYYGEKKHVILKLAIPQATEAACARGTRVCGLEVTYTSENQPGNIVTSARIQYVKPGKESKEVNEEVKKQLMLIEAAKIQKEAKEKADKGDFIGARSILDSGIAGLQDIYGAEAGGPMAVMLTALSESYVDANTYRSKGTKLSSALYRVTTTGRSSSSDTIGANFAYMSQEQENTLKSFTAPPASAAAACAGTGNMKIMQSDLPTIPDDLDSEKKV